MNNAPASSPLREKLKPIIPGEGVKLTEKTVYEIYETLCAGILSDGKDFMMKEATICSLFNIEDIEDMKILAAENKFNLVIVEMEGRAKLGFLPYLKPKLIKAGIAPKNNIINKGDTSVIQEAIESMRKRVEDRELGIIQDDNNNAESERIYVPKYADGSEEVRILKYGARLQICLRVYRP